MYVDTYFVRGVFSDEIITGGISSVPVGGGKRAPSYKILTSNNRYFVDRSFYNYTEIGDTLIVSRSPISGSPKILKCNRYSAVYNVDLGFISSGFGVFFSLFVAIVILIVWLRYEKIEYLAGRANLTFFLAGMTLFLFWFYLLT